MSEIIMNTNNNPEVSPEVKPMNFIQRVSGVIVSPGETMKNLTAKPRILFPFIMVGLGILLFYLSRYTLYMDFLRESAEAAIAQQGLEYTPEQMDATMKLTRIIGLVGAPFGAILMWLITAVILFVGAKILKGEGSFKQYMSVTGYAYVITILYYFLSAVVSFFSGQLMLNTSLGLLVPDMQGTYIYGILRSIDLFTIWYYMVVTLGVLAVSKLSKTKVYAMMSIIYIGSILIGAGQAKIM